MQLPQDYVTNGLPANQEVWVNGMDLIAHCLKKDTANTLFKDQSPASGWSAWTKALQQPSSVTDQLQDIYDNAYTQKASYIETQDDMGDLDVSAFIGGEELCFTSEQSMSGQAAAVSVLFDISVPWGSRDKSYMVERQKAVYSFIAQCDSENRPVQIVGCYSRTFSELEKPVTMFVIIKDYNDSVFPTIWGGLKDNRSTNLFLNVIADYFIGTRQYSNGSKAVVRNAERFFPDNEHLIIFSDGDTLKADNAEYHNNL